MLRPCPACARHVRAASTLCPFCTGALEAVAPPSAEPEYDAATLIAARPSRAELFLRGRRLGGAALVAASLGGCAVGHYGLPPYDAGPRPDAPAAADAGNTDPDAP